MLQKQRSGGSFPVLQVVRENPDLAATISKLHTDRLSPTYNHQQNRDQPLPDFQALKRTSDRVAQSTMDAQVALELFPELGLAVDITVSSILCPKDLVTSELTFSLPEGILPGEVSASLIGIVREYFEKNYKIKPLLPKILKSMLAKSGSYPIAVIPESSVDEAINGQRNLSMESLSQSIRSDGTMVGRGLLGPARRTTPRVERSVPGLEAEIFREYLYDDKIEQRVILEDLKLPSNAPVNTYLSVTDNVDLLKIPDINQKIREQRVMKTTRVSAMEAFGGVMTDRELTHRIFKDKAFTYKPITSLKTPEQLTRRSVGNPLVMHLPSEAVIPLHVPGAPEKQVGIFVLVDQDGNPISHATKSDYYSQMANRLNSNGDFSSAMLSRVKGQVQGMGMNQFDFSNGQGVINYTARAYAEMVEQDLLQRLKNGVYTNGVQIGFTGEISRIMLARALAKQHTQLLFIPAELMTYFAFQYNDDGTGRSMLEDLKILNSLRAMLSFANTMAAIRNSIGRTDVKLKLDPEDPDPQKSVEIMMDTLIHSREQQFPIGASSPVDIVSHLNRAAYNFSYEGHSGLPDVGVDFAQSQSSYPKADTELDDSFRKRAIMGMGMSPEIVDASMSPEFATVALQNNALFSKRIITKQDEFTPQLADHLRKIVMHSENCVKKLQAVIADNFEKLQSEFTDEMKAALKNGTDTTSTQKTSAGALKNQIVGQLLYEFVMNFEVALPRPNSVTLESQMLAMEGYSKALDAGLDAWLSSHFFTADMVGEGVSQDIDVIREVVKAHFMRQYMAEAGILPELANLTTVDEHDRPVLDVFDSQKMFLTSLGKSMTKFLTGMKPITERFEKKLAEANVETTGGGTTDAGGATDDSGGLGGGGEEDGGFGLDNLGGEEGAAGAGGAEAEPGTTDTPEGGAPGTTESDPGDEEKEADKKTGGDDTVPPAAT